MIIKSETKEGVFSEKFLAIGKKLKSLFTSFLYTSNVIILIFILVLVAFKPDILKNGFSKIYNVVYSKNYLHYPEIFFKYFTSQFILSDYIQIDVKHMDMQKLEYTRQKKLKSNASMGALGGSAFEYVSADIKHKGKTYQAKIRLKGDRGIHYKDISKLSFRIKLNGDNTLLGMKVFSIHKPRARNYIYEWLWLEMMKQEGIITPEYKFINVRLNGKDLGSYALEEHYSKYLIERYGHRDGPIIRFSETLGERFFRNTSILPYEKKKWMAKDNLPETTRAVYLLEEFIRGKTDLGKTFDIKKLAKFYAISDLFETFHGYVTKSLRFYHNPITGKLEPIPFDGHYLNEKHFLLHQGLPLGESFFIAAERAINPNPANNFYTLEDKEYLKLIFNDPNTFNFKFYEYYIQFLKKISDPEYLAQFFKKINKSLSYNLQMIYKNFPLDDNISYYGPGPFYFHESLIYRKQDQIRTILNKHRDRIGDIQVHGSEVGPDYIILEIISRKGRPPIEVIGASCGSIDITPEKKLIVVGADPPKAKKFRFLIPKNHQLTKSDLGCLTIRYKVLGLSKEKQVEVLPWNLFDDRYMANNIMKNNGNIDQFQFVELDENKKTISIKPGEWMIDKKLIIPPNYKLNIPAGTKIDLKKNGLILSYSPLNIQGTKENPVMIGSEDGSGYGLVILQAKETSKIRHTHFYNLRSARSNGWNLTGAVTFYESPVEMVYVKFSENKSEDALNIVRSKFFIKNSVFSRGLSDAVDIDFGKGIIEKSQFRRFGNDAIDVSGSEISLKDISISDIGDKGISAGENSNVKGDKIEIWNSNTAVASKDRSYIKLNDIKLNNVNIGFSSYQKKPEFGPGHVSVHGLSHERIRQLYLVEQNSEVFVDGREILDKHPSVKEFLYPKKTNPISKLSFAN